MNYKQIQEALELFRRRAEKAPPDESIQIPAGFLHELFELVKEGDESDLEAIESNEIVGRLLPRVSKLRDALRQIAHLAPDEQAAHHMHEIAGRALLRDRLDAVGMRADYAMLERIGLQEEAALDLAVEPDEVWVDPLGTRFRIEGVTALAVFLKEERPCPKKQDLVGFVTYCRKHTGDSEDDESRG